jgi:hypothetical protein
VAGRWTPKLEGAIYCSPACGGCCKKEDFDRASERAHAVAKMLGAGWVPRVWENLGWHFDVSKGLATVSSPAEGDYEAVLQFTLDGHGTDYFKSVKSCPREAVESVHADVGARISALKRALQSVSLDVVEIAIAEVAAHK